MSWVNIDYLLQYKIEIKVKKKNSKNKYTKILLNLYIKFLKILFLKMYSQNNIIKTLCINIFNHLINLLDYLTVY